MELKFTLNGRVILQVKTLALVMASILKVVLRKTEMVILIGIKISNKETSNNTDLVSSSSQNENRTITVRV
ncbi:hypothetical protein QVD17_01784 [Tagetes erecta]|uniref:Uncharacterized protein n=1 Tax=Tagetes erecta TaxID=13708 RepID=A0AAD8P882_TARER|nr:hypothetical protein QVD17_01784 [Tagetes erecta]